MNRRDALNRLTLTAGGLVVLPATFLSCEKNDPEMDENGTTIDLSKPENSDLNSPGGYIIKGDIIVINSAGSFVALSKICTHNGCTVSYSAANNNLPCPCHGSLYAIDGSVLNGPATMALKTYSITRSGDILTIK